MATIQFENGKKVKFDGNPTPQDIDFVAKQMGIMPASTSTPSEPPKNGFLKDLAIGITKPVVRGLTGIAGAVQGTAGFLSNNKQQFEEGLNKMNNGVNLSGYGETRPIGNTGKGFGADVKDAVGVGAELGSYIPGAKLPQLAGQALKQTILQGAKSVAKEGAVMGGINSVGRELQSPESTLGSVAQQGLIGAGLGAGVGGILGGATAGVPSAMAARAAARQKKAVDAVGRVLQGETKDIEMGRKILSEIDPQDIKTYKDLQDRMDEKIGAVSGKLDEAFETNQTPRILDNLSLKTTVGGQTLKQNYVEQALNQLDEFYTKTNNLSEKAKIAQLRQKAQTQGLTVKEINQVAKQHGKDLSGFNASGELASGLSKQAAENTRSGVKATVRDLFGNNLAKAADSELTKLIKVRDLAKDMVEKVNDLQQKIQPRNLGNRVGRLVEQAVNIASLGSTRGFVEALLPRGVGYKTLNALDLEAQLSKNLKLIQKAAKEGASEKDIIQSLEEFITNAGGKLPLLLPEKAGAPKGLPLYGTQNGMVSPLLSEASEAASRAQGKIPAPGSTVPPKPYVAPPEPYTPDSQLPTIPFGQKINKNTDGAIEQSTPFAITPPKSQSAPEPYIRPDKLPTINYAGIAGLGGLGSLGSLEVVNPTKLKAPVNSKLPGTYEEIKGPDGKPVKITIPKSSRLSFVNNNPGNLKFSGQDGASKGEGGFAKFRSPEVGFNRLVSQIKMDANRNMTLGQMIDKFAPKTENDTAAYKRFIEDELGTEMVVRLSDLDPTKVAFAVAKYESGSSFR